MTRLRPATLSDAPFLFRLRTDTATQMGSYHPAPDYLHHLAWLDGSLRNGRRVLLIAEVAGHAVATIRLDQRGPGVAEISLTVAPEARRQGYGLATLAAVETWGVPCLLASIKPDNLASIALFTRAGYTQSPEGIWERRP